MSHSKATKFLRSEIAELRQFAERERALVDSYQQRIADYGAGKTHVGIGATYLDLLANHRSIVGAIRVIDGDPGGFQELDLACLYQSWIIRSLARAFNEIFARASAHAFRWRPSPCVGCTPRRSARRVSATSSIG